jgi:hypothetical protein
VGRAGVTSHTERVWLLGRPEDGAAAVGEGMREKDTNIDQAPPALCAYSKNYEPSQYPCKADTVLFIL